MYKFIIFLLARVIVEPVMAVPYQQPTMAVLPFQLNSVIQTTNIGDLVINRTLVEHEFSNELMNFLTKSRKFNIVSRSQIDKVMNENLLTESDWVDPTQSEKMGRLLVADYLVTGVINRLETNVIRQNLQITGETAPRIVTTFKCQFQVIESATGKVKLADQVIYKLKSTDVRREISATERRDWTYEDYKDLLFSRTATEVGNAILGSVYPIKIVDVRPQGVILNRGRGAGIEVGSLCQVISQGKPIIDYDTGESLGGYESNVGLLEVTSIETKFSKAKVISGANHIKNGYLCRLQKKKIITTEPGYPKVTLGW